MSLGNVRYQIMQKSKSAARTMLKRLDIGLVSYTHLQKLMSDSGDRAAEDMEFLLKLPDDKIAPAMRNLAKSHAQLRQDLFVLSELNFKRQGFFVEFGATNGVDLSNTHLLEKEFGWTGILAEPAKCWRSALRSNRSCRIDTRCVWRSSGETVAFNEVKAGEFSTVDEFSGADFHEGVRKEGTKYSVDTITLLDLLDGCGAPENPDYLSIDTEGSEFEILRCFDFQRYKFRVITCEHNFTPARDQLHELLARNGYTRKFEDISKWDDWYVRAADGC